MHVEEAEGHWLFKKYQLVVAYNAKPPLPPPLNLLALPFYIAKLISHRFGIVRRDPNAWPIPYWWQVKKHEWGLWRKDDWKGDWMCRFGYYKMRMLTALLSI